MKKELNDDYFLWRQFKDGSEEAFYILYDKYVDILYRLGMQYSNDREFIKDCIHDLFVDLYKYRKGLSETNNIKSYLICSLRRKIHKGKNGKISVMYNDNVDALNNNTELPFEEFLISSETEIANNKALNEMMKTLTTRQREALSLKFYHNLSYSEIAQVLGISIESARTCIYRSLQELRKGIKEKGYSFHLIFLLKKS